VAHEFGSDATVAAIPLFRQHLKIIARVPRASGAVSEFHLVAEADGAAVDVREDGASLRRLPSFCPERHINFNGTFCLFWREGENIPVHDLDSARRWFGTLIKFLYAQFYAERRRKWPVGAGRAHGNAARHQVRAEAIAAEFGDDLLSNLVAGRLTVQKQKLSTGGTSLRLLRDGKRLFAMREHSGVVNLRSPCPCGGQKNGRPLLRRRCGKHATLAAELVRELIAMEEAERAFWTSLPSNARCCSTMQACPLDQRRLAKGG
jgi:hypothetical protein